MYRRGVLSVKSEVSGTVQKERFAMTRIGVLSVILITIMTISMVAVAQGPTKTADPPAITKGSKAWLDLEKELWDADLQWLCSAGATPYHKVYRECVEFRSTYWSDQFFEVVMNGEVHTKAEMISAQRAANATHVNGAGPYPDDFHLMAVYGNFALATDHTNLKSPGPDGKLVGVDLRVLRMFVKENGKWRPAGAALVPIAK